jgi:Competence protein J (ComJ)
MSSVEFPILVSYSQVTVFDHSLERPFNQWTDKHVAQGFSWRPGSAAFRTIAEGGPHLVTVVVDVAEDEQPLSAVRIVDVPFEVPADGTIEIGSVSDCSLIDIPSGTYTLRFECYEPVSGQAARIRFVFARNASPIFHIVRADPGLSPEEELLLSASAA